MLHSNLKRKYLEAEAGVERTAKADPPVTSENHSANLRRAALTAPAGTIRVRESALYRPMRPLGAITDGTPLAHQTLGSADFVTASIGRGYQVYECEHLRPAFLGPRLGERIRALLCVGEVVVTALKADIVVWYKYVELGRFRGHKSSATLLCNVGTGYLLSAAGAEAFVWPLAELGLTPDEASKGKVRVLPPSGALALDFGECTAVCSLPTYLHKLLVGSSSGGLELWNVRSRERVHRFQSHGGDGSTVTALCDVPNVLDLVGVGFASGRICIINALEDTAVSAFEQAQGKVTGLAFRTGRGAPAHMVSGAPNGSFVVWDLDKRRAHHVHERAHIGPVASVHFLFDQGVLITSGRDNAIRMWIFDTPDGLPRPLRERQGCPGPPRLMSYYNEERDSELIIAGQVGMEGYMHKVACGTLAQHRVFSQANVKKLPKRFHYVPPIVSMDFCRARHWDWPAIVTAHEGADAAFLWSAHHFSLAPYVLQVKYGVPVTAVALSHCGNYCVLGLSDGTLHRFNLQSQLYRGEFPKRPEAPDRPKGEKDAPAPGAHCGRVSGVAVTISGLVTSVSAHPEDCRLKLWKLLTHEAVGEIELRSHKPGSPSCLLMRARGTLLAVSLDDGMLLVIDLDGRHVVRSFDCGVPARDLAFSFHGRWLAAALRNGGLRIFDLPAARCVDSFAFSRPVLSLCFSPSGAFLLTSHSKGHSIQTWANKFLFDPSLSAPLLQTEPEVPINVDEPCDDQESEPEAAKEVKEADSTPQDAAAVEAANPLAPELLTLSDVPPQKWLATLHLDLVKERNKPKEAPKPLPNAPFFLPTAFDGVTPRFAPLGDAEGAEAEGAALPVTRIRRTRLEGTEFQVRLRKGDFDGALKFLKEQTPSGVHLAIEELGSLAGGDADELKSVLNFFLHHLGKAHYADEVQAYLSLFLQAHGEELSENEELRAMCLKLSGVQERVWAELNSQCQKAKCFLGILTQTQSQW